MTMNVAHFPHQGAITSPTIDDYRTELALMEDAARKRREVVAGSHINGEKWRRWKSTIRRLEWAASTKASAGDPSRSERSEAA